MSVSTGIHRRVYRDGKYENVLLEDHTKDELLGMWRMELECGSEAQKVVDWMFPLIEALKSSEAYRKELQDAITKTKERN